MSTLTNWCKGLAAVALIAASPILIIFTGPFAWGLLGDLLEASGGPVPLSITAGLCVAALCWARYRMREPETETPARRPVKSLG